jgi:hypothetical protein
MGDVFDETQNGEAQQSTTLKCPICGQDYNPSYPHCPYCAAAAVTSGRKVAVGAGPKKQSASGCVSLVVVAIILFFGLQFLSSLSACSSNVSGSDSDLTLQSSGWTHGQYGNRTVAGSVVNSTNRTYAYAQVQINLYDAGGAQVGSTMANVNNLAPGAVWKFEAPVLEDSATRFEVTKISGF